MRRTYAVTALVAILVTGIFVADASAYYHPGLGQFVSRDPGSEGSIRIGAGGATPVAGFVPRDEYRDGMNLYRYVRGNPVTNRDPSGLITWHVDESTCEINAIVAVKPIWIGDWTEERKADFQEDATDAIESTFNSSGFKIIPKNASYRDPTTMFRPCPCPSGFKPTLTVLFYENNLGTALAPVDWQPTVRSNPSKSYQQSWTFGSLGPKQAYVRRPDAGAKASRLCA